MGIEENDAQESINAPVTSLYTRKYRILKTILLHLAYLQLGMNNEIFGVVLEDLRILLKINYQAASSLIIAKIVGYIVFVAFVGFIIDRFIKYSDLIIAGSTILISTGMYQ